MSTMLSKFDPAVDKRFLIALSGFIWSVIGVLLIRTAYGWLTVEHVRLVPLHAITGMLLALIIHHFGFIKIADRNIGRILSKKGKVCVFGFQPWKSYAIILIMVSMGAVLRQSPMPKQYLSVIYIGFGGAMLLSSFRYYRIFYKNMF